jgi:hypothetical protein
VSNLDSWDWSQAWAPLKKIKTLRS